MSYTIELPYEVIDDVVLNYSMYGISEYLNGIYDTGHVDDTLQTFRFVCSCILTIMQYPSGYVPLTPCEFEKRKYLIQACIDKMCADVEKFDNQPPEVFTNTDYSNLQEIVDFISSTFKNPVFKF